MYKYPLHAETEQEKKGYVKYETAIKWCNESFFDGYIAAMCETAEDYEAIGFSDRVRLMRAAVDKCAILMRESPNSSDLSGGVHNSPYPLQACKEPCSGLERGL